MSDSRNVKKDPEFNSVKEWWEAVGKMVDDIQAKENLPEHEKEKNSKEYQEIKRIYREMVGIGKQIKGNNIFHLRKLGNELDKKREEFAKDSQQKIVGPLSLELAQNYLALLKKMNPEDLRDENLLGKALEKGYANAKIRAEALEKAIQASPFLEKKAEELKEDTLEQKYQNDPLSYYKEYMKESLDKIAEPTYPMPDWSNTVLRGKTWNIIKLGDRKRELDALIKKSDILVQWKELVEKENGILAILKKQNISYDELKPYLSEDNQAIMKKYFEMSTRERLVDSSVKLNLHKQLLVIGNKELEKIKMGKENLKKQEEGDFLFSDEQMMEKIKEKARKEIDEIIKIYPEIKTGLDQPLHGAVDKGKELFIKSHIERVLEKEIKNHDDNFINELANDCVKLYQENKEMTPEALEFFIRLSSFAKLNPLHAEKMKICIGIIKNNNNALSDNRDELKKQLGANGIIGFFKRNDNNPFKELNDVLDKLVKEEQAKIPKNATPTSLRL